DPSSTVSKHALDKSAPIQPVLAGNDGRMVFRPHFKRPSLNMLLEQSLIDRLREAVPDLNKAERRVAEAVLADIDAATRLTIKELALLARVSEPTVVRLARKMGCEGYTDFKLRLSQD